MVLACFHVCPIIDCGQMIKQYKETHGYSGKNLHVCIFPLQGRGDSKVLVGL